MIHEPLQMFIKYFFLSYEDKNKCLRIAERIQELTNSIQLREKQFVHGDMHFGKYSCRQRGIGIYSILMNVDLGIKSLILVFQDCI